MRNLLSLAVVVASSIPAAGVAGAPACNQDEALATMTVAFDAGIISATSMWQDTPTMHVDRAMWDNLPLQGRLGMFATFQCAVVGADKVLARAQIIAVTGELLATWDGLHNQMETPH